MPWFAQLAAGLALVLGATAAPSDNPTKARLKQPRERVAVAEAIRGAALRLAHVRCLGLLDEFADASGQPLRAVLAAQATDAGGYLERIFFYDANPSACEGTMLAGATGPGSRVIRVCGRRFERTMAESSSYGEALIIHEMLHSLGLGENPPTTQYITSRVRDRCRE